MSNKKSKVMFIVGAAIVVAGGYYLLKKNKEQNAVERAKKDAVASTTPGAVTPELATPGIQPEGIAAGEPYPVSDPIMIKPVTMDHPDIMVM